MTQSVIELSQVTITYRHRVAVSGLTLEVPRGLIYGFLGPNGAGKTTTIKGILGLKRIAAGHIRVLGQNLLEDRSLFNRIGAMIDPPGLYPHLTGAENLRVAASYYSVRRSRCDEVLEIVGLRERASVAVRAYSQGMKQRLGLALALLTDPDILILDEPLNGLDPIGVRDIRELLSDLVNRGKTILLSSHFLTEVSRLCENVALISDGMLVYAGSVRTLLRDQEEELLMEATPQERAVAVLNDSGCRVLPRGKKLGIKTKRDTSELIALLTANGVSVSSFTPSNGETLEDVFFRMTGKGKMKGIRKDDEFSAGRSH